MATIKRGNNINVSSQVKEEIQVKDVLIVICEESDNNRYDKRG
jgi:hypothetical protein